MSRDEDLAFFSALRRAKLLRETSEANLSGALGEAKEEQSAEAKRLHVLDEYYSGGGDRKVGENRRRQDRFFLHRASSELRAVDILQQLEFIAPEVGPLVLERIGTDDGPIVLRAGDDVSPLIDAYEESLDTDEIDLRDVDSSGSPLISVHSLVQALNGLLARRGVRERMVELRSDGAREAYIATTLARATEWLEAGYLEDEGAEELMDFADW